MTHESQGEGKRGVEHQSEMKTYRPSSQILRELILDLVPQDRPTSQVQETVVHRTRVQRTKSG